MFSSVSVYHLNFVFCLSLSGTTWIKTAVLRHTSSKLRSRGVISNLACFFFFLFFLRVCNPKYRAPPTGHKELQPQPKSRPEACAFGFTTVVTAECDTTASPAGLLMDEERALCLHRTKNQLWYHVYLRLHSWSAL